VLPVVSPNGDGIADGQALRYRVVHQSDVSVTLTAPSGAVVYRNDFSRPPGTYSVPFPPPTAAPAAPDASGAPASPANPGAPEEGTWTLSVSATDDEGQTSSTTRRFTVNSTLGFLRVAPRTLLVPPGGKDATVGWKQTRPARITARIETRQGVVLRTIAQGTYQPGDVSVVWNGIRKDGQRAYGGLYEVVVTARNGLGSVSLQQQIRVRRVAGPKK
jgi:hypothetical protein